ATAVAAAAETRMYQLRAPSGELQQLRATAVTSAVDVSASGSGDWQLITEPLLEAGIWEVSAASPAGTSGPKRAPGDLQQPIVEFAVSAAVESEVDLRPVVKQPSAADASSKSSVGRSGGSLTGWLLLLTLLLLAIDWALHQRRWLA
ncbi:MAG: hypothetical protein ACKOEO_12735, partial [Planctomycetaceae bacterium]